MTNMLDNINISELLGKIGVFTKEIVEAQINNINKENLSEWAARSQARAADGLYYLTKLFLDTKNNFTNDEKIQFYYKNPEFALEAFLDKLQEIKENPVDAIENYSSVGAGVLGFLMGYAAPNLKISILGLSKQSIITHSIIPVITLKKIMDIALKEEEVFDFTPVEEQVKSDIIKLVKHFGGNPLLIGFAFGVGVHLMLDAIRSNDGIVLTGLPTTILPGGRLIDRAWLLVSALICFSLGKEYINACQNQENEIMTINDVARLFEKRAS
ncbi:hypothetical protein [Desulfolucanica intricata]|uniref:hypothetical protein n=1 Tax=Desulfolucanica intricata TaxID=1285191 RepID=UPI000835148D|nr:hypothetical protein [Desulfolucanica intricata]